MKRTDIKLIRFALTALTVLGFVLTGFAEDGAFRRAAPDAEIREKLDNIIIPEIDFEEATIHQVIHYLRRRSRELDPDGEGVNFILHLKDEREVLEDRPAREFDNELDDLNVDFEDMNGAVDQDWGSLTLNMSNVPLSDLIRFVCMAADLQYLVDRHAIIISDRELPAGEMYTRFYSISPGVFRDARDSENNDTRDMW